MDTAALSAEQGHQASVCLQSGGLKSCRLQVSIQHVCDVSGLSGWSRHVCRLGSCFLLNGTSVLASLGTDRCSCVGGLAPPPAKALTDAMVQGGLHLLVSLLSSQAVQQEAALWALQSVIALHPSNQAAAVQAGALPKLVGLLETGPDTAVAEYAADCVCFLAQVTFLLLQQWACFKDIYQCSFGRVWLTTVLAASLHGIDASSVVQCCAVLCMAFNYCCCQVVLHCFGAVAEQHGANRRYVCNC